MKKLVLTMFAALMLFSAFFNGMSYAEEPVYEFLPPEEAVISQADAIIPVENAIEEIVYEFLPPEEPVVVPVDSAVTEEPVPEIAIPAVEFYEEPVPEVIPAEENQENRNEQNGVDPETFFGPGKFIIPEANEVVPTESQVFYDQPVVEYPAVNPMISPELLAYYGYYNTYAAGDTQPTATVQESDYASVLNTVIAAAETDENVYGTSVSGKTIIKGVNVYYHDGNNNIVATEVVNSGSAVKRPDDPGAEGVFYNAWYTTPERNVAFDFTMPVTEDLHLYAGTLQRNCKVTFASERFIGNVYTTKIVRQGTIIAPPKTPVFDEAMYQVEFTGWYTDVNCTVPYDFSTPVSASMTLYAGFRYAPFTNIGVSNKIAATTNLTQVKSVKDQPSYISVKTLDGYVATRVYVDGSDRGELRKVTDNVYDYTYVPTDDESHEVCIGIERDLTDIAYVYENLNRDTMNYMTSVLGFAFLIINASAFAIWARKKIDKKYGKHHNYTKF